MTKVYMKVSKDKYQLPEVIADRVKFLDWKEKQIQEQQIRAASFEEVTEDLPF